VRAHRPHRWLSYRPGRNAGADPMTVDGVTALIVYDPDINYPLAMIKAIGSTRGWNWMTRSRMADT
jgi:hypothetical protein